MSSEQTHVIVGASVAGAKAAETRERSQPGTCGGSQHARGGDPYDRLPYFFSDQYDVGMEYSGYARTWDRVVFRGDPSSREFIAFWLVEDRVVAGMNVNVWDVTEPIQALIRDRVPVDDRRLADTDIPLTQQLRQSAAS